MPSFLTVVFNRLRFVLDPPGVLLAVTFAEYAAQYPGQPAHGVARQRMQNLYERLLALDVVPYGTPELVGYAMDAHIPMIANATDSVFGAYRRQLAPEQLPEHAGFRCLVSDLEQALASDAACAPLLQRLLAKGAPFPGSVRYVSSQLHRCASDPQSAKLVERILRASFLGSYPHAKVVARPEVRIELFAMNAVELLEWFGKGAGRPSYAYYYTVAEFVYAASRISPLHWHWARCHPRYAEHGALVTAAGDSLRRGARTARHLVSIAAPLPGALSLSCVRQLLGGRKKLTVACQQALPPAAIAAVYRRAVLLPGNRSVGAALVSVGGSCFAPLTQRRDDGELRRLYQALSLRQQAVFQVIVHGLLVRDTFVVAPLHAVAADAQRRVSISRLGSSMYMVIICRACGTWRSKAPIAGLSRGTIGVRVAFPVGTSVQCNACLQTWGTVAVNMVGNAVRVRPRIEALPVWVVLCTACGVPSDAITYHGILPVCSACAKFADPFNRKRPCYACSTTSGLRSFCALQQGTPAQFLACPSHWPRFSGHDTCDIDAVRRRTVSSKHAGYMRSRRGHW